MNYYFRYITIIEIFQKTTKADKSKWTLPDLARHLQELNVSPCSAPTLSRLTSLDNIPQSKRNDKGIIKKFKPLVGHLEALLKKHIGFQFNEKENRYENHTVDPPKFQKLIETGSNFRRSQVLEEAGIEKIYSTLKNDHLRENIAKCDTKVRILETFLTDFEGWKPYFLSALKNNARVEILLAGPRSKCAQLRTKGLSDNLQVRNRIENNIEQCKILLKDYPNQFEIRFYDEIPPFNLYWHGDTMIMGWFWFRKYSIDGSFMELNAKSKSFITINIEEQWNELWNRATPLEKINIIEKEGFDTSFKCFFIRDGDLQNFDIHINHSEYQVIITNTNSGDDYLGEIRNLDGYLYLAAETNRRKDNRRHKDRIASMLIHTANNKDLVDQELAIATYSNISPVGRAYANIAILIKMENGILPEVYDEQRINIIHSFLNGSEIATNISLSKFSDVEFAISNRNKDLDISNTFLPKIAGDYYLFTDFKDKEKNRWLRKIAVSIKPTGEVIFYGGVKQSVGTARALNAQFIQIEKITQIGAASYSYILQIDDEETNFQLYGYGIGISRGNRPKWCIAYLFKHPKENFDTRLIEYPMENNLSLLDEKFNHKLIKWFMSNPLY